MKRLAVALALLAAALSGGVGRSEAVFVASSTNPTTFSAAAVFNAVSINLSNPGTPLYGTVALSATASSDRPIVSVRFQSAPAGSGTWTDRCTDTSSAYTCDWNTAALADGYYDLRAIALDSSGYSQTSTVLNRRVENTAPTVSLTDPGTPLTGTKALAATASDGTGVASVAFQYRTSPSGSWTTICTDNAAAYTCNWNTATVADGLYDLRALATDTVGNTATSVVSARRVDNTAPTVTVDDNGLPRGAAQTLSATLGDGNGTGVASVQYQYRTSPSGTWTNACSSAVAPFSCAFSMNGGAFPEGYYDLRATATDGAGLSTTSAAVTIRLDKTNPSAAAMTDPGSPLSGTVTLNGTATDAVGMAALRFEYKSTAPGSPWVTACTDSTPPSPFSCSWDTTQVADGTYDVRAVAIDQAGNTRNSANVASRIVDNHGPVVSVTGPAQLRGATNTITTSVTDASPISNVVIRYRPSGSGSYTTVCTDSTGPDYTCTLNATGFADGASYDLIAIATDSLGKATTSAVYTTVVNTTGPTATDVQSVNGGVNDKLDAGDAVTFSFSAQIAPASVLAGWNGTSTAIRVRVNNSGAKDTMEFYDSTNTTALKLLATGTSLTINGDHVSQASLFNANIAQSGSTITVTIGSLISGAVRNTATGNQPMVWQPNPAMTNLAGKALFAATVTESGALDVDF